MTSILDGYTRLSTNEEEKFNEAKTSKNVSSAL